MLQHSNFSEIHCLPIQRNIKWKDIIFGTLFVLGGADTNACAQIHGFKWLRRHAGWGTAKEEHGILTYNGRMFSLPHFHFQLKSVNIYTNFRKRVCIFGDLFLGYHLEYISFVRSSVNKQIRLNCVLLPPPCEGSVGVAPEVNLRHPLHSGNKAHKWENPSWRLNPGQTSPEVQSRGDSLTTDLHWHPHSAPEENKFIIHRQEIQVIREEKGHRLCGRKLCQVKRHNVTSCRDFDSGKLSPCERIFRQDIISIA